MRLYGDALNLSLMDFKYFFAVMLFCISYIPEGEANERTCDPSKFIIAVDIGHTLNSPGATSARGVTEFDFNHRLATLVVEQLQAHGFINTITINKKGDIGSLAERTKQAADSNANLFLSIHHDSVQPSYLKTWVFNGEKNLYSDIFSGYSLFVSSKNPKFDQSLRAAVAIGLALRKHGLNPTLHHAENIPGENRPLLNSNLGIYRFDDLVVLKSAIMPAVLLEAGVIVNRSEEVILAGEEHQQLVAISIVEAVRHFCNNTDEPYDSNDLNLDR
ncbi:MAG: N-acetylmuramoyl-L-alanine amidase [Halomonas sp.]|uniref:N-acetylmuramoyl-L-alanine amidase family protein n=1 Tax=Halomonas sp. TaxID=1486246 RepID=UPI002ACE1478|nr:N-acetylmuramoyl-L-alanine amidase [Halomonas sp.]MDZ7852301.1 N-acetylmuramoyl-L-alanine amidase [Halomonas sp.]